MKLTVIGGAGARSPMLLKSLAGEAARLKLDTLVFMDDDPVRLEAFGPLLTEAARRLAPSVRFRVTGDAREALEGADYVITTIRAGSDDSRVTDERVALSRGLIGQETTGAGGFAMALRSIPALIPYCEMARDSAAPGFMMFNFTNPAGLVTQALRDLGYGFVYGICDAPTGLLRQVARLYGRPSSDFRSELIGLNHLSYFTSLKLDGREVLPELLQNPRLYGETDMRYFKPELAQHMGCAAKRSPPSTARWWRRCAAWTRGGTLMKCSDSTARSPTGGRRITWPPNPPSSGTRPPRPASTCSRPRRAATQGWRSRSSAPAKGLAAVR